MILQPQCKKGQSGQRVQKLSKIVLRHILETLITTTKKQVFAYLLKSCKDYFSYSCVIVYIFQYKKFHKIHSYLVTRVPAWLKNWMWLKWHKRFLKYKEMKIFLKKFHFVSEMSFYGFFCSQIYFIGFESAFSFLYKVRKSWISEKVHFS